MDFSQVPVEATPDIVQRFVSETKEKYLDHLKYVQSLVTNELSATRVYKIYGRDEKQSGESIKEPRKIRMKFNRFNRRIGKATASLWDSPDIVGFTIVVSYPSEINQVTAIIDRLVEDGVLVYSEPPQPQDSSAEQDVISSIYGRAFKKRGYFACHYNLRRPGIANDRSPICEIQIKTVLFDAWGAKTHNLTYKTDGAVDESLVKGFELLGDSLAVLDIQSDTIRDSIEKVHKVRNSYLAEYLSFKCNEFLMDSIEKLSSKSCDLDFELHEGVPSKSVQFESVLNSSIKIFEEDDISEIEQPSHLRFNFKKKHSSIMLFCHSLISKNGYGVDQGREMFVEWVNSLSYPVPKIHAYGMSGIVNFFSGDIDEAINETSKGLEFSNRINDFCDEVEQERYRRVVSSLHSSMAYYYAVLVGSHHGNELEAKAQADENFSKFLSTCPADEVH